MTLTPKTIVLSLCTALVIIVVASLASSRTTEPTSEPPSQDGTVSYESKQNEGGNVTVTITPLRLTNGFPASFDVAFETHSVDLAFDVEKIVTLTDGTNTVYAPAWDGSPPGGHHRNGTLRFTPDLAAPTNVTLTFSDIAGVPSRTFTWVYPEESSTKGVNTK